MSDIQNEIFEHLRLLGTHCGSLTALHGLSVIHLTDAMHEIKRLRSEVERLRLRPEEMDALSWCRDVMPRMWEPCAVVQIHSEVCGKMLARLGGWE